MEKGLTLLPGVLPPKLKGEPGSSLNEAGEEKQSKEGNEHGALLAQILELDTTGLLSSVRFYFSLFHHSKQAPNVFARVSDQSVRFDQQCILEHAHHTHSETRIIDQWK